MSPLLRTLLVPSLLLLAAGAVALFAMNREAARVRAGSVSDMPLAPSQDKLLDLAFRTASALPLNPHARTRGRLQQDVVDACLAFDAPQRALACAEKIQDWRRGLAYTSYAYYCASHGKTEDVLHFLQLAQQIAEQGEPMITQDWQKDRIRVGIAKTHAWLGHAGEAATFEAGLEHAEMGKVDAVRALRADASAFDEQLRALQAVLAGGDFELSQNALETCAQLFNRYYEDADRRARVSDAITSNGSRLPPQIRIDVRIELSGFALDHKDGPRALEFVDQARKLLDGERWLPENYVPLAARLGALRFKSGATKEGRLEVDEALARFDKERALIVNINRAGALRPVAEAYLGMGDKRTALALYKRAVEEGVENPNSRPRAEDLVATCLSMAWHGVEPDAELSARLEKVFAGLGAPW